MERVSAVDYNSTILLTLVLTDYIVDYVSIGIELKEVIETQIDWEQLISDIKDRFNVDIDIDEF